MSFNWDYTVESFPVKYNISTEGNVMKTAGFEYSVGNLIFAYENFDFGVSYAFAFQDLNKTVSSLLIRVGFRVE